MSDLTGAQTGLAKQIARWRRANLIKQSRLAAELGVSQQAVSAWERGLALPSPQVLARLRTMLHEAEPLLAECAAVKGQSTVRALIDADGARLLEYSRGFEKRWGDFCRLKGECLEDRLVNEMQSVLSSGLRAEIVSGQVVVMSGVSYRHVDVDLGEPFLHRWHVCFRRYGARVVGDMVFEQCEAHEPTGIDLVLRLDALRA